MATVDTVAGRLESRVGRCATGVIGALLASTALGAVVWPQDPNLIYRRALVVVGLLVGGGLMVALNRIGPRMPRGRVARIAVRCAAVVVSVVGAALGAWLAGLVAYQYGWDAKVLSGFSAQLHASGQLSPEAQDYLSRYPNNVPLVAMMNICRSVAEAHGTDMDTVYRSFNAVCLGLSLLLVFELVRMLRGPWAGLLAQFLTLGLVGCSPWMTVPYTDLPAIPPILAGGCLVVVGLRGRARWTPVLALPAAGACFGIAYVVKSTPAAAAFGVAVALLIVLLTLRPRGPWLTVLVATTLSVGMFFGSATLATVVAFDQANVRKSQLDAARVPPPSWWMALGLISRERWAGGTVYGGYNGAMVSESRALRGAELRDWSRARLSAEFDAVGGIPGIVPYETRKQLFNWGDGMFYAWGEGLDVTEPLQSHSRTARTVQSWNHGLGEHYVNRASLTNGLWLSVVLCAGLSLMVSRYRRDLLALGLAVLGALAFTLLFQGRSRYLFAYVPVVIALATSVDIPAEVGRRVGSVLRRPSRPGRRVRAWVSGLRGAGTEWRSSARRAWTSSGSRGPTSVGTTRP